MLKIEGEKTTGKNIGESHLLYKMIKENKAFIIWFCQTVFHQYKELTVRAEKSTALLCSECVSTIFTKILQLKTPEN